MAETEVLESGWSVLQNADHHPVRGDAGMLAVMISGCVIEKWTLPR